MRKAFTRGELIVWLVLIVSVLGWFAAWVVPIIQERERNEALRPKIGDVMRTKAGRVPVVITGCEYTRQSADVWVYRYTVRVDNGEGAPVRFTSATFFESELEPITEKP